MARRPTLRTTPYTANQRKAVTFIGPPLPGALLRLREPDGVFPGRGQAQVQDAKGRQQGQWSKKDRTVPKPGITADVHERLSGEPRVLPP